MVAQFYHSIPDRKEAMEALDRVGLADRAEHLPRELSGGEQQRVCIARALINYPVLILADEPTGNLDSGTAGEIIEVLKRLAKERNKCVIVVTHSPEVAAAADTTLELSGKKLRKVNKSS